MVERLRAAIEDVAARNSPEGQAQQLTRIATDIVRPLSHELAQATPSWQPPPATAPRVRLTGVVDRATARAPFLPATVTLLATAFLLILTLVNLTWRMLPVYVVLLVGGYAVLAAGNVAFALIARGRPLPWRVTAALLLLGATGLVAALLLRWTIGSFDRVIWTVLAPAVFIIVGITAGMARAAARELTANLQGD